MLTKSPFPYSEKVEGAVLAKCLFDQEFALEASDLLSEDSFYLSNNKLVFRTIKNCIQAGAAPDSLSVSEQLKGQVDGSYIADLVTKGWDVGKSLHDLSKTLNEKAKFRKLVEESGRIMALASDEKPEAFDQTSSLLVNLSAAESENNAVSMSQLVTKHHEIQAKRNAGELKAGIPFGYKVLDLYSPGARNKNLILVAARPSQGKSAFLQNIMLNFARQGKHVYMATIETSSEEVMDRIVGNISDVGHTKLQQGNLTTKESEAIEGAYEELSLLGISINDYARLTTEKIYLEGLKLKLQGKLDVILVDYVQLVADSARDENEERRIAKISIGLKRIAKQLDVPVIAAAQLNRQVTAREDQVPRLSDLRHSGQLEQDADLIIGLWQDQDSNDHINFKILKYRDNYTGATFKLGFQGAKCRLLNYEHIKVGVTNA